MGKRREVQKSTEKVMTRDRTHVQLETWQCWVSGRVLERGRGTGTD